MPSRPRSPFAQCKAKVDVAQTELHRGGPMRSPFSVLEKGGKAYLGKTSLSPVFLLSTTQST